MSVQPVSHFRTVFQTTPEMQKEFVDFLRTIFFRLDEKKVLATMARILEDPAKTDEMIYNELVASIKDSEKSFSPIHQIRSLNVLQKGMGKQARELTKPFKKEAFHDYAEIYFRRYLNTIRKTAKMPLDGTIYSVANSPAQGSIKEKIESQSLLAKYPYKDEVYVPLNDADCQNPDLEPEKTHKALGDEIPEAGLDMVNCLGGLHHIPQERHDAFVQSMHDKLRPGAVLLLRDHDVTDSSKHAIVSVVHSFVNASDNVPWAIESKEVREFHTLDYWTKLLEKHNFTRVSKEALVLQDDPTNNAMMAFIRAPQNLDELKTAAAYRNDIDRPKDGTKATWIEWGNVRYSKQYAEFLQDHHAYAFDYVGHLRQHFRYVAEYIKESKRDNSFTLRSDNFAMNVFILFTACVQCAVGYMTTLPSRLFARVVHGKEWQNDSNLSALERAQAAIEREYSAYIDHTPFYMFPWVSKIKTIWSAVWNAKEGFFKKASSVLGASLYTVSLLVTAAVSLPIRALYTTNGGYVEPDTIKLLVRDPASEITSGVIYETPDSYKIAAQARYRDFTEFCKNLPTKELDLLEIGGQSQVSVDVLLGPDDATPQVQDARVVYEMDKLQDAQRRRYVTYMVNVQALKAFVQAVGPNRIEYVHE